jgi:hypothetical protein
VKTAVFMLTGEPMPNGKGDGGLAKAIAKKKAKPIVVPPAPQEAAKEPTTDELPKAATYIYRDEHGAPYLRVRKYIDADGKKQYPQAHWNGQQWVYGK